MLNRVLEPEVMDSPDEAHDYDSMDHLEVNRRFVDDLLNFIKRDHGDYAGINGILDVGTGTAQIPIELCSRLQQAQVTAVDLSTSMLELAMANVVLAGLADQIFLELVDAKRLPYRDGEFALLISNSIVHHVPEPRAFFAEAVRVTATGGCIFVRDLLRPESDNEVRQLVETYAAGANDRQRELFRASLHAALSLVEVQQIVEECGFPASSVAATSDRHWTFAAQKSV